MSYFLCEYQCVNDACGHISESLEVRGAVDYTKPCALCGYSAVRCLSAVRSKTVWGQAATRGKPESRVTPYHLDTEPLGDGMALGEFRKRRSRELRDLRNAEIRGWTQ